MNQNKEMLATLVQVAHLYFEKDRSQQEIADQLGVSRSLIALYLKKASEQNIVRIEIVDPQDIRQDLTMRLQAASGAGSFIEYVQKGSCRGRTQGINNSTYLAYGATGIPVTPYVRM